MVLAIFLAGSVEAVQRRPQENEALQYRPYVDGRTPWYKTSPSAPATDFPHNYFVPDFGVDHDIKFTKEHTAAAEARLGHVMQASFKKPAPPPQDYFVPNFGKDVDMINSENSIASSEATLGTTWTPVADANGYFDVPQAFAAESYSYNADNAALLKGNRWVQ